MTDVLDDARTIAAAAEAEQRRVGEEPMTADTERKVPASRPRSGWTGTMSALAKLFVVSVSIAATMAVAVRVFMFVAGA